MDICGIVVCSVLHYKLASSSARGRYQCPPVDIKLLKDHVQFRWLATLPPYNMFRSTRVSPDTNQAPLDHCPLSLGARVLGRMLVIFYRTMLLLTIHNAHFAKIDKLVV